MRSSRAEVRNPVLGLPAAARLSELPPEARDALRAVLADLRADSRARADDCWARHKAPMAAYWKAVSVYAGHIARALGDAERRQKVTPSGTTQQSCQDASDATVASAPARSPSR